MLTHSCISVYEFKPNKIVLTTMITKEMQKYFSKQVQQPAPLHLLSSAGRSANFGQQSFSMPRKGCESKYAKTWQKSRAGQLLVTGRKLKNQACLPVKNLHPIPRGSGPICGF
jgi:hypothetical protein